MNYSNKRDFGSFFNSNVNDLVNLNDTEYTAPALKIKFNSESLLDLKNQLGSGTLRKDLFYLTDEFKYLNHGAFGLTFKPVVEYVFKWEAYAESQPLRFYDREIMPLLADLIRLFARRMLHCEPNELVLVENCTFAFNSILNSMILKPSNKVVIFNTTYGIYKKLLRAKCEESGAELLEETIMFPIQNQAELEQKYVEKLRELLKADSKSQSIKYVFVDHIPSNFPFVLPIGKLSDLCKSMRDDVVFVVDGAHTLGSVKEFSLEEFPNVDLMFFNCHKWLCGPKGSGFLFKNKRTTFQIRPAIQSHGFGEGFTCEFVWTGLKQYSSYLGLLAVVPIWEQCLGGLDNCIEYCIRLAREAGDILVKAWSTGYLVDPSLCTSLMCVKLPIGFIRSVLNINDETYKLTYDDAEEIQNFLHFENCIEVPVKCLQNELYVRISCHVYNYIEEYKFLGDIVLKRI